MKEEEEDRVATFNRAREQTSKVITMWKVPQNDNNKSFAAQKS